MSPVTAKENHSNAVSAVNIVAKVALYITNKTDHGFVIDVMHRRGLSNVVRSQLQLKKTKCSSC